MQPSEFWGLTLSEWMAEFDFRAPTVTGGYAGKLTHGDVQELKAMLDGTT